MNRLSLLLLLAACSSPAEPSDLGSPIPPRPEWRAWFADVWTRCGSTQVAKPAYRFESLEFRVVPGQSFRWGDQDAIGAWQGDRIYLSESVIDWPVSVRHEMLHAQLARSGHPPIFATCDSIAVALTSFPQGSPHELNGRVLLKGRESSS